MPLKEKTIELLKTQGVKMDTFGAYQNSLPSCATVCCLAGTIVQAAEQLGILEDAIANAELYDYGCGDLVPRVARAAWRRAYGEAEAERLGFYEEEWTGGWVSELRRIKPETVIEHIEGEPTPYDHHGNLR